MDSFKQDRLKDFWDSIPGESSAESEAAFERFCEGTGITGRAPVRRWRYAAMAAAAVLLIAITSGLTILTFGNKDMEMPEYVELRAAPGVRDSLVLPDNSKVWLNSGSRLLYPKRFAGDIRKVFLFGEGYFSVQADPAHPFIVSSGEVCVRVLGTEFNMTAYDDLRYVSVSLVKGAVDMSVAKKDIVRNILLSPGEVVRFDREDGTLEKTSIPPAAQGSWKNGDFYFYDQPLAEITSQFERSFGKRIVIPDPSVRDIHYTIAFVNGETLPRMLSAITEIGKLRFRDNGDYIVISR
ncbi:MAG: FecR domain-containing protein [Bacteroidales bacterium]|nr:FecR domain-containing protein [Bacteroidales bacterium]